MWHYLMTDTHILQNHWKLRENLTLCWLQRSRGCARRVSGESPALFVLSALNCFWLPSLWRCWASLIFSSHTQRVLTQQGKKTGFHRVFFTCQVCPVGPSLQGLACRAPALPRCAPGHTGHPGLAPLPCHLSAHPGSVLTWLSLELGTQVGWKGFKLEF